MLILGLGYLAPTCKAASRFGSNIINSIMLKLHINKLVSKPICGSHGHDYPDFECIDVSASRQVGSLFEYYLRNPT